MKVFFVPSPLVLWNPWLLSREICLHEWFVFNVYYSIGQILFYIHFWMFPCFQRMDFPASHVKLPEDRQMLCGFDCGSVPVPWSPAFPGASLAVCKCRPSEESEVTGWLLGICALLLQIYEKMGPLQKRVLQFMIFNDGLLDHHFPYWHGLNGSIFNVWPDPHTFPTEAQI